MGRWQTVSADFLEERVSLRQHKKAFAIKHQFRVTQQGGICCRHRALQESLILLYLPRMFLVKFPRRWHSELLTASRIRQPSTTTGGLTSGRMPLHADLYGQLTRHIFSVWVRNFRSIEAGMQQSYQVATRAASKGLGQAQPLHSLPPSLVNMF